MSVTKRAPDFSSPGPDVAISRSKHQARFYINPQTDKFTIYIQQYFTVLVQQCSHEHDRSRPLLIGVHEQEVPWFTQDPETSFIVSIVDY